MARFYSAQGSVTNTASATLPLMNIISTAAVRTMIDEYIISGDATPADNYADYTWQRGTTTGTAGSNFTPVAVDPGDPAAVSVIGLAVFGAGPTLTASAFVGRVSVNQRSTYRWVANTGYSLKCPAVANNGLNLMCLTTNLAFTTDLTVYFQE